MSKMSELHAEGVTDLYSYNKGVEDATANIIKLLKAQVEKWDLITEGEPKSISHFWCGLVSTAFISAIEEASK
jgi:hypothetical protein